MHEVAALLAVAGWVSAFLLGKELGGACRQWVPRALPLGRDRPARRRPSAAPHSGSCAADDYAEGGER